MEQGSRTAVDRRRHELCPLVFHCSASATVLFIFEITGIDQVIPSFASRDEAPPKGSRRLWHVRLESQPDDVLLGLVAA